MVLADAQAVAQEAAEQVVAVAQEAIQRRGRFTFALAGGSTPALLYELLASPEYAGRIDWTHTHLFFGDERCVPPDHEWSNYGMAWRTLFDLASIPSANIHRIRGELPPREAAAASAGTIREVLAPDEAGMPRFDLVLLGMGDDGHTASLFPGMPVLDELNLPVAATPVPEYVRPQVSRVTLTFPVLNAAEAVVFLVTGPTKAEPVRRVLVDARDDPAAAALPAARVRPGRGKLLWLLDVQAASLLKGGVNG